MPKKPALIKTIVTSELQRRIAKEYGAECFDTLTGFKFIGDKIGQFEKVPDGPSYVIGGEESYGYLVNTEVRDKDAVSAALMTAEMVLYYRSVDKTLFEHLREIWLKHGYFQEILISKYFKGESGVHKIQSLMEKLRKDPPELFAGQNVLYIKDYLGSTTFYLQEKDTRKDIELPSSNVIQFILADCSIITARPSGTEPKIKFYASCCSEPGEPLEKAMHLVQKKTELIRKELNDLIDKV